MYREVNIYEVSEKIFKQLEKGAFLTVKHGDRVNTMTIAWGSIAHMWYKPVFMVMVRYSRFTYELIDKAGSFTVSFPLHGQLKDALAVCGTKSGRDIDKIKECGLTLKEGQMVDTPIIDDCDLHIECKIIYKEPLKLETLSSEIKDKYYSQGNQHVLYYGEILKVYVKE